MQTFSQKVGNHSVFCKPCAPFSVSICSDVEGVHAPVWSLYQVENTSLLRDWFVRNEQSWPSPPHLFWFWSRFSSESLWFQSVVLFHQKVSYRFYWEMNYYWMSYSSQFLFCSFSGCTSCLMVPIEESEKAGISSTNKTRNTETGCFVSLFCIWIFPYNSASFFISNHSETIQHFFILIPNVFRFKLFNAPQKKMILTLTFNSTKVEKDSSQPFNKRSNCFVTKKESGNSVTQDWHWLSIH